MLPEESLLGSKITVELASKCLVVRSKIGAGGLILPSSLSHAAAAALCVALNPTEELPSFDLFDLKKPPLDS